MRYTKAQLEVVERLKSLVGKTFNESSLTTEINKIVSRTEWVVERVKNGICVLIDHLGIAINVRLQYTTTRKEYKALEVQYL